MKTTRLENRRTNPDFLNGVPELVLLKLLDRRPMHGYELVRSIKRETGDALAFGEGCVYPVLHKLESQGLLESRATTVRGRERYVYHVTPSGRTKLKRSAQEWTEIARAIQTLLQGGNDDTPVAST
ncbi:MAG: helix-turn-helix transcriptional regulator [Planctomycetales bacterium]|nr:helix-turn-helix transcriptional regulator [Planctomycetales bacterium]